MKKNKIICITTFCEWTSYGSIMQAIGLKKTLKSIGFDSFIARSKAALPSNIDFSFRITLNPKLLIKNILNLFLFKHTRKRYFSCNKFIRDNVDCIYYNEYEVLKRHVPEADFYLTGSDQVWNPALCSPTFFLDFVKDRERLSYAASMGLTEVPAAQDSQFGNYVKGMDVISVRETAMVNVLKKYTDKPINVHIDPTFLLDTNQWREYEEEYPVKKPYILVYALFWNKKFNRELKELKRKSGFDIIALCADISSVWANKKIYDASPGEFLWLIDNAEAVVSSSFHGVAFALNFNKKFAAVINPASPSRIADLLKKLHAPVQGIADVLDFDISKYKLINRQINVEREQSVSYLKEILHVEK